MAVKSVAFLHIHSEYKLDFEDFIITKGSIAVYP